MPCYSWQNIMWATTCIFVEQYNKRFHQVGEARTIRILLYIVSKIVTFKVAR